jgi:hypothetical protein
MAFTIAAAAVQSDTKWQATTNGMTLEAGKQYIIQNGHTVTFPTGGLGDSIAMLPANGNWATLTFTLTEPAGWTIGAGQSNITATGDMVTFAVNSATNWLIATGGVALPPSIPTSVANMVALDALTVSAGQNVTVSDVGAGKFASFYFPTSGAGNQANRQLVSTDQNMSHSNFSSTVSGDMGAINTDYTVQSAIFTAPIGAKRANFSAWGIFACAGVNPQMIRMHFHVTRVSDNDPTFRPNARPRMTIPLLNTADPDKIDKRTIQLTMLDSEVSVVGGQQYNVELIASKKFPTGDTTFREGLIKVDWRG